MLVTELSDAQPRPRRVAVGEFDAVRPRPPRGDPAPDTVLTFEPHPLRVVRPEAAPKLLANQSRRQGRADRQARRRRAGGDPFDRGICQPDPGGVHRPRAGRAPASDTGGRRGELPLRAPRRGRSRNARRRRAISRCELCRWLRSTASIVLPQATSAALVLAGEVELASALPGAARFRCAAKSAHGERAGPHARVSLPPISSPTRRWCALGTESRRSDRGRRLRRGQHRRASHVLEPAGRCSRRGLSDRSRRVISTAAS